MLRRSCLLGALILLGVAGTVGLAAGTAEAAIIPLTVELDNGITESFGQVIVTTVGDDLEFVVEIERTVLGPKADLHEFYFNLDVPLSLGDLRDALVLVSDDAPNTPYSIMVPPTVAGSMGYSFEVGVSFGNGAGRKGNRRLESASFVISLPGIPLSVASLDEASTIRGGVPLNLAVHVQGTDLTSANSETIGGQLAEPASTVLLALALAGLAALRRRPA